MLNADPLPPPPRGQEGMLGYLIQAAFQQLFHEKVKCQKACMLHVCVRVYVPSSCLDRVSQTAPYILSLGKIFDRDRERHCCCSFHPRWHL